MNETFIAILWGVLILTFIYIVLSTIISSIENKKSHKKFMENMKKFDKKWKS